MWLLLAFYDPNSGVTPPILNVYWSARTGDDKIHTQVKRSLSDQAQLSVDPGTGNVLLSTTDMSIAGTGPGSSLSFRHYFNSYDAYLAFVEGTSGTTTSQLGAGWSTDNSLDSTAKVWDYAGGGSATVIMPGGVQRIFTRAQASGAWNAPDGMNADFGHNDTTHITTLTDHKSGLTYSWTDTGGTPTFGHLTSITTPAGQSTTFTTTSTDEKVTDTKGRSDDETLAPVTSDGLSYIQSIIDNNGGRSVSATTVPPGS